MIEGFGDDAVALFGGSLIFSLAVTYSLYSRRRGASRVRNSDTDTEPTPPPVPSTIGTSSVARPANTYGVDEDECPICMDTFGDTIITTNCGHNFDLCCFMAYASHQTNPNRVSCPTCRQTVSLLFPNFDADVVDGASTATATAATAVGERSEIRSRHRHLESFRLYNRINGNVPRTYYEVIRDVPELIRQIFLDAQLSRQLLTTAKRIKFAFLLLATGLYLLSPFDLIPESMFGAVGYIDDLLVVVICFIYITSIFREIYVLRYRNRNS